MKNLATKAVVTGPGFYYRQEHEWRDLNADATKELQSFMDDTNKQHAQRQAHGNHTGPLTAVLSSTIDGVVQPDVTVPGISYAELVQFQRHVHAFTGRMLDLGDDHAQRKSGGHGHNHP